MGESEEVAMGAIPAPARVPRAPAWSIVLPLLAGPIAAAIVSVSVIAVAIRFGSAGGSGFQERSRAWIAEHAATIPEILVLLLPAQLSLFAVAAVCSRSSAGVIGTLGVQWLVSIALDATGLEPSRQLQEMWRMMSVPTGATAAFIALLISATPAICEEALFRGFGQRRLVERWHPAVAIAVASALFAVAHMDVQQSTGVFPIGLWLGFVAWRTGSLWVSGLCHFANNMSAFVFGRLWGNPTSGALPSTTPFLAAGAAFLFCTWLAARTLNREARAAATS